jgi:hypothetical protein
MLNYFNGLNHGDYLTIKELPLDMPPKMRASRITLKMSGGVRSGEIL